MKVSLIHFTGKDTADPTWYAARLLAFTKSTRLKMTPLGLVQFMTQPRETVEHDMEYMSSTIASSWEFVHLMFSVEQVSVACARQIMRTRVASYAQQSQRVTNLSEMSYYTPETLPPDQRNLYKNGMDHALATYDALIKGGASLEDARGVLPMNLHCNFVVDYNLRAWVDVVRSRESLRVQGEYRSYVKAMKAAVLEAWPWAASFIEPKTAKAIAIIEKAATELAGEQRTALAKAADLLKKETA